MSNNSNGNSDTSANNSSTNTKQSKLNSKIFTDGKSMNIFAAATANIIAENYSGADIEILSQFFSTLSDLLDNITTINVLSGKLNDVPIIERNTTEREIL